MSKLIAGRMKPRTRQYAGRSPAEGTSTDEKKSTLSSFAPASAEQPSAALAPWQQSARQDKAPPHTNDFKVIATSLFECCWLITPVADGWTLFGLLTGSLLEQIRCRFLSSPSGSQI